jgi:putative DNA primase/helicase
MGGRLPGGVLDVSGSLTRAAFRYGLKGLHIFPARGKRPLVKGGCHAASRDADAIRAWWRRWPNANVACATGSASDCWAALAQLEATHGALPLTPTVITPGGGEHRYWRWPSDGPEIRNSAGRVGLRIDVRGEAGSAILPPSVHAYGSRYRWAQNGAKGFADAPTWLLERAQPPSPPPRPAFVGPSASRPDNIEKYVSAAAASELLYVERAAEGTRNHALNRAAFALAQFVKAGALPEPWARQQLEARALSIGLSLIEARGTISSAFAAAQPRELPR